jgi:hypothetical protein
MRRLGAVVVLAGAAALLSGCVYDPYTGSYYPCCSYYGNPYYRYPPAYYPPPQGYPQGYPSGQPQGYPSGQPQGYPSGQPQGYPPGQSQGYPSGQPQGYVPGQEQGSYQAQPLSPPPPQPGASAYPQGGGGGLVQRFATANVTHDGRLTREQAGSGMPMVARNFDTIDIEHKGYITLPEIRAFAAERRAAGQSATE